MQEEPTLEFLCQYFGYAPKGRPLESDEVAEVTGLVVGTLRLYRIKGVGPKFLKGPGSDQKAFVKYPEIEVLRWMYSRLSQSTSEKKDSRMWESLWTREPQPPAPTPTWLKPQKAQPPTSPRKAQTRPEPPAKQPQEAPQKAQHWLKSFEVQPQSQAKQTLPPSPGAQPRPWDKPTTKQTAE